MVLPGPWITIITEFPVIVCRSWVPTFSRRQTSPLCTTMSIAATFLQWDGGLAISFRRRILPIRRCVCGWIKPGACYRRPVIIQAVSTSECSMVHHVSSQTRLTVAASTGMPRGAALVPTAFGGLSVRRTAENRLRHHKIPITQSLSLTFRVGNARAGQGEFGKRIAVRCFAAFAGLPIRSL